MNKKIVVILIILLVILIFIISGIIVTINKANNKSNNRQITETQQNKVETLDNSIKMLAIEGYIQDFLKLTNNTNREKSEQNDISTRTYNLLSKEYIDKNSITQDNVYDYVTAESEELFFVPLDMKKLELTSSIRYAVYGACIDTEGNYKKDVYFIFNVDNKNKAYSIEPVYNAKSIDDIKLTDDSITIEVNKYNGYKEKDGNDEYICEQYLLMYKRLMLIKPEYAYEHLNEDYRKQKFDSLQEYSEYISNNKDKLIKTSLKTYSVKDDRYICQDQFDNYYIFNLVGAFDYDVMLDVYTVDLDEFIQKYNSSDDENKVSMNIAKVEQALNNKDYKFIYNKLDENFRNNNYSNIQNLKTYINQNFFDNCKIQYVNISNKGNVYVYNSKMVDTNNESNTKEITIVMQLLENRNFRMSFSM